MIYIGAWHKTGINAIKVLFRMYKENVPDFEFKLKTRWNRNFNHHILENSKAVLCIRNPYEIIMSGMRYHQITKENLFNCPQKKYNGKSYQECICDIESIEEKILFEMKNNSYLTINGIYKFLRDHCQYKCYSNKNKNHNLNDNIAFIRLEQFWTEQGRQEVVNTITSHIPDMDKDILTKCIKTHGRKKFNKTHSGFNYTYQDHFTDSLYKEFDNLFPEDLLENLGYSRK